MSIAYLPSLAKPEFLWYSPQHGRQQACHSAKFGKFPKYPDLTLGLKYTAPEFKKLKTPFSRALWHSHRGSGISTDITNHLLKGIPPGTRRSYSTYTRLWYLFYEPRSIDPLHPSRNDILEHFAEESKRDASKSKSTLKWILPEKYHYMLDHVEVRKFCSKNNFRPHLGKPRLTRSYIWDKDMVIDYYRKKKKQLSFMELSEKAAILFLLATAKRPSEVRALSLNNMRKTPNKFIFTITCRTKTSRWNNMEDLTVELERLRRYIKGYKQVCPYLTLEKYIEYSDCVRKSPSLFVTTTTGTPVSSCTLARWTKNMMDKCGIDTTFFKPYSTCSAAVSKEAASGTSSLQKVLKMGKWHGTTSFFRFYLRRIKYFKRKDNYKDQKITNISYDSKNVRHVTCALAPSASLRCKANHSLRRALTHCRGKSSLRPIFTDLPPAQQELINCGELDFSVASTSYAPSDISISIPPSPSSIRSAQLSPVHPGDPLHEVSTAFSSLLATAPPSVPGFQNILPHPSGAIAAYEIIKAHLREKEDVFPPVLEVGLKEVPIPTVETPMSPPPVPKLPIPKLPPKFVKKPPTKTAPRDPILSTMLAIMSGNRPDSNTPPSSVQHDETHATVPTTPPSATSNIANPSASTGIVRIEKVIMKQFPDFQIALNYTHAKAPMKEFMVNECLPGLFSQEFKMRDHVSKDWVIKAFHGQFTHKIKIENTFVPMYEVCHDSQIYSTLLVTLKSHALAPQVFPFDFKLGLNKSNAQCSFTFLCGTFHMKVFVVLVKEDLVNKFINCGCIVVDCGPAGHGFCLSELDISRIDKV